MKQAAVITSNPSDLSPEFTAWMQKEKSDARHHQLRVLKASLLIVFGAALFLMKLQPEWLVDMLGLTASITPN